MKYFLTVAGMGPCELFPQAHDPTHILAQDLSLSLLSDGRGDRQSSDFPPSAGRPFVTHPLPSTGDPIWIVS